MASIQDKFRAKIGEVAYTSDQVRAMLSEMNLGWYSVQKIRNYVKEHSLFVDMEAVGIGRSKSSTSPKYWIPRSNLVKIIEGLQIPASERDFEDAAFKLDYPIF